MKIAHLILTHKNPGQLERLLKALRHEASDIFLHVDRKVDIRPFMRLAGENVHFIRKRARVAWGDFGTIQATINGFHEILPLARHDYINVISGQDFPLKPAGYIYDYIKSRKGKEFITCESMDSPGWNVGPRIRKYHLVNWRIPGKYRLEKLVNRILPPRKFPFDHDIVGRANWFTLSREAVLYSLDFLRRHPELIRYYKYCWGADEFIFSTILYNSYFREHIVDNLIYVDWSGPSTGHPKILGIEDFEKLKVTDKLFARKMDMQKDAAIFTMLEQWMETCRTSQP
jgi:hypothetical protein